MNNDKKRAFINQISIDLHALAAEHGDGKPLVAVEIVDTDPEPMSANYVQAVLSFKAVLE